MNNEKIKRILTEASDSLDLVKQALFDASRECVNSESGGEWQVAKSLFTLAENADLLKRQVKLLANGSQPASVEVQIQKSARIVESGKNLGERLARKRKADYPKYEVRGDRLVKIGLGRDRRTEYLHEVPKDEFDKIITRLVAMLPANKGFTADQVQESLDCPIYQTYIVLAVLLKFELLISPKRGLYKFTAAGNFAAGAGSIWQQFGVREENAS